jgi:hypothetical protein
MGSEHPHRLHPARMIPLLPPGEKLVEIPVGVAPLDSLDLLA